MDWSADDWIKVIKEIGVIIGVVVAAVLGWLNNRKIALVERKTDAQTIVLDDQTKMLEQQSTLLSDPPSKK